VTGPEKPAKPQRNKAKVDERLAAALRENLRRRKEQERARETADLVRDRSRGGSEDE
jgi:hypothetical protein